MPPQTFSAAINLPQSSAVGVSAQSISSTNNFGCRQSPPQAFSAAVDFRSKPLQPPTIPTTNIFHPQSVCRSPQQLELVWSRFPQQTIPTTNNFSHSQFVAVICSWSWCAVDLLHTRPQPRIISTEVDFLSRQFLSQLISSANNFSSSWFRQPTIFTTVDFVAVHYSRLVELSHANDSLSQSAESSRAVVVVAVAVVAVDSQSLCEVCSLRVGEIVLSTAVDDQLECAGVDCKLYFIGWVDFSVVGELIFVVV